ncbi:hypothetical protein H0H93_001824 [Arthromyces matolae]|nr:hypothetical protein H0H93_001824 [Arthromyces matolae]
MHRCLQIPEVVCIIFEHVRNLSDSKNAHKALARLARTCKSFSSPALDILWYTQFSLLNLLKCFPKDVITLRKDHSIHMNRFALNRKPKLKDYERVLFYGSRIRLLGCTSGPILDAKVDTLVYSTLLSQRRWVGPLLPNLQGLEIDLEDFMGQVVYVRLTIGPSLHRIKLQDDYGTGDFNRNEEFWRTRSTSWNNALAVLAPHVADLQHFQFSSFLDWIFRYPTMECINSFCQSFRRVQSLRVMNLRLTNDVLKHLSTLPHLSVLEFGIDSKELRAFVDTPSSPEEFNKIASLSIFTDSISACTSLLSRSAFHHLLSLCIGQVSAGGDWDIGAFVSNLVTPFLETLEIWKLDPSSEVLGVEPEDHPPIPFTRSMLYSLLSFPSVTCLDITFDLSLQLDDDDIKAIATAWPDLRKLSLPDHSLQLTAPITFEGLLSLTQHCKQLGELTIRVDASKIPDFASSGVLEPSNLLYFDACTSPLHDAPALLEIIPLIFPRLDTLNISDSYKRIGDAGVLQSSSAAWRSLIHALRPSVPSYDVHLD